METSRSKALRFWRTDMSQEPSKEILELLLVGDDSDHRPTHDGASELGAVTGAVIGVLVQRDKHGQGHVAFDASSVENPVVARTTVPLRKDDIGRQVCLL